MKKTITIFTMLIMIIFLINISCTGDVVYIISDNNNTNDADNNNDDNVTIVVETDTNNNNNNTSNTGNNSTSSSNSLSGKWEGYFSYENPETKKQERAKGVFTFTNNKWKLEGKSGGKPIEIYNGSYNYDERNGNLTLIYERMNSGAKMIDIPNGFLGKQVETIGFDNNRMVIGMYVGGDTKTLNGKWRQTKSITLKGADKPFFNATIELDIRDGKVKMSGDFVTTSDSGINNTNDIGGWGDNFDNNNDNNENVPDFMNNTTMAFSISGNAKIKNLDTGSQTFTVYESSDKPEKEEDNIFSNGDYRYITVGNGLFFAKTRNFEIDYFERIN